MRMAGEVWYLMTTLTPEERVAVLEELRKKYCFGCGCEQKVGRLCQCQNDD